MKSVLGVIQARMGSSRVSGKAMLEFGGRPLVWHIIDRMRRVRQLDHIVLATTTDPRNVPLVALAKSEGLSVFQYSDEDDIAGRIAGAIRGHRGDLILKTGGDCPLIDPAVLQKMVDVAITEDGDFVSNRVRFTYPLGLSADVVSRRAIEWSDANLVKSEERELFALYIRDHPEQFKVVSIVNDVDLSNHGWTVDEPADVDFVRGIFDAMYVPGQCFGMAEVLNYLDSKRGASRDAAYG